MNLAALRIHAGHDVANHPVFAAGIHRLQDHEERVLVRRIVKLLQGIQFFDVFGEQFLMSALGFVKARCNSCPLMKLDFRALGHAIGLSVNFHLNSL